MSEKNIEPQVRSEEPELNDESLEQVAGGCQWGDSKGGDGSDPFTIIIITPTFPTVDY